jgi:hypothetical protein
MGVRFRGNDGDWVIVGGISGLQVVWMTDGGDPLLSVQILL